MEYSGSLHKLNYKNYQVFNKCVFQGKQKIKDKVKFKM